jgi:hypothetical protein
MADKYKKVTTKVHPLTYVGILGFIIVIVGLILIFRPTEQEKIYASYINMENIDKEAFTKDHPFDQIKYKSTLFNKGLEDVIDEKEYVLLYIGTPACAACVNNIGAFQYYYEQYEMDNYFDRIYYVNSSEDVSGVRTLNEEYQQITDTTPQLIVFQDGEILTVLTFNNTNVNQNVFLFYQSLETLLESE